MGQRPSSGLYGGLFEFPSFFVEEDKDITQSLKDNWKKEFQQDIVVGSSRGVVSHVLTHMKIDARIFNVVGVTPKNSQFYQKLAWITSPKDVPMSTLGSKVFDASTKHQQLSLFAAEPKK